MKLTKPSKDLIPLRDALARMRIDPSCCLDHFTRLMYLTYAYQNDTYVLCMGATMEKFLHCWLESQGIVVDLTRPVPRQRFYLRSEYYEFLKIDSEQVKRYTPPEAVGKFIESGHFDGPQFWDFDTEKYFTFHPGRDA